MSNFAGTCFGELAIGLLEVVDRQRFSSMSCSLQLRASRFLNAIFAVRGECACFCSFLCLLWRKISFIFGRLTVIRFRQRQRFGYMFVCTRRLPQLVANFKS